MFHPIQVITCEDVEYFAEKLDVCKAVLFFLRQEPITTANNEEIQKVEGRILRYETILKHHQATHGAYNTECSSEDSTDYEESQPGSPNVQSGQAMETDD